MKKLLFITAILITTNVNSQTYVPDEPIITSGGSYNYSYSENYISGILNLIIKDENYYKHQDNIAQEQFDNNLITIKKAQGYYEKKDWASAIYYGKDINYTNYYEINNIKYFMITTSYFYLEDIGNSKKWYDISRKTVDPETMRSIDEAIKRTGMDNKISNAQNEKIAAKKKRRMINSFTGLSIGGFFTVIFILLVTAANGITIF